jgi:AraC-like DNA-binding protein
MWSLFVITSIIFQSAVAIYLLNGVRTGEDIDKQLRAMLIILLVHVSTKFLLLAVLKDQFLYAHLPTGFSFAYGPLLLIIARGITGRPVRPRYILLQFLPFLVFSLVYVSLAIAGAAGLIARSSIRGYVSWYDWLILASLYGYPLYVKFLLRGGQGEKTRLVSQITNILLMAVTAGFTVGLVEHKVMPVPGFDLRLIPYICLSAIPILILRYRLRTSALASGMAIVSGSTVASGSSVALGLAPVLGMAMSSVNGAVGAAGGLGTAVDSGAAAGAVATPESAGTDEVVVSEAVGPVPAPVLAENVPSADRRYEKSGLDAAKMDEYEASLAVFMRKSKIYLDPDLSLEGLALRMKMSKHHLTQLLNERIMKNFYTYINEYRIGEAVDRLNDPSLQVNILSLAFDCGFNSRSSFNSYFKKITGYTPSAYRKNQPLRPAGGAGRSAAGGAANGRVTNTGGSAVAPRGSGGATGARRSIRDTSPSA